MRLVAAAFAVLFAAAASSAEVEGIQLPPRVQLGAGGPQLVLNGAGVRVRLIFKIYVAGLYLPARSDNGEAILRRDQPLRFTMYMLRTLSAEQINSSITEALRETLTPAERQPVDARMARFSAVFDNMREVKEGTQVTLDYQPAQGTVVIVNGEQKERIAGADFIQALMRVWLGERPRDPELRQALLGIVAQ